MKSIRLMITLVASLLVSGASSYAQNPAVSKGNATVSGRITIGGQPAAGIKALLKKRGDQVVDSGAAQMPAATATTDADGRFRFTNLAAGAYRISVFSLAHVIEGESRSSYEYGKTVSVADDEEVENLDFSLTRGGVITGKGTDGNNMPVIAEGVGAFRLDRQGKHDNSAAGEMLRWQTDDRGVYRIFGLESGQYIVGVGTSSDDAAPSMGNHGSYRRTYHPDVI